MAIINRNRKEREEMQNSACVKRTEELISVNSNNGVLEMKSVLKDRSTVIRTIGRTFRYDDKTGKYIFQNRYLL